MSSTKFIARNGLAVGTSPVDVVDSTGELLINAPTASKLLTARTISLSGDVVGSVSFDGSGNAAIATTIQADSVALGTDTTGNYMLNVSAGTGVSVSHTQSEGSTATVSIGQAVGTSDNVTFNSVTVNGTLTSDDITSTNISVAGNATITGNLTVSGTTTTINSTTIAIADLNLELARNATTAAAANGAGITVTGPVTPATLTYTSADDRWNLNKNLNVSTVYGALSGNASTATTLQTTRAIQGVNFDGSAAITVVTAGTGISVSGTAVTNTGILSISGTAPVSASTVSGATTISMAAATASVNGYMTSTYAAKLDGIAAGATNVTNTNQLTNGAGYVTSSGVTSVSGTAPVVSSGGTTPAISMAAASSGVNGYMTGTYATKLDGIATGATNVTNTNQLTNGAGYITGYTETDTLATVTGRGASTSSAVTFSGGISTSGLTLLGGQLYVSPTNTNTLNSGYAGGTDLWLNYRGQADGFTQFRNLQIGDGKGVELFAVSGSGAYVTATNSFRAPIFYDSNNTGYYVDPAATPLSLKVAGNIELTVQSASWAEGIRINVPSTSTWGGIRFTRGASTGNWAIGYTGLNATDDFTIYSGTTNTIQVNLDHSANLSSIGSMRAPVFYDSNNTAYYGDFASTSNVNAMISYSYQGNGNVGGTGSASWHPSGIYSAGYNWLYGGINAGGSSVTNMGDARANIFYDYNDTGYYANPAGDSQFSLIYANNWFRPQGQTGVYSPSYGIHFWAQATTDWGMSFAGNTNGSLSLWQNHQSTRRIYLYFDTGGSGLLTNTGNWGVRQNYDGGASPGGTLYGSWISDGDHRAPIFYDSNDTSYYANPNSFSQMSYANFNGNTGGRTLSLGSDQTDRVYNDTARASLVINATYYPHLYINAVTNNGNEQHGAVFSMTGNLSAGGYRRWGMGIANTNPDCFSWGYADNNTNPHYGVGGTFGYTGTNSKMWLNTGGSLWTVGDMRSPIFYDSNDTSYYTDPNSGSRLLHIFAGNVASSNDGSWNARMNLVGSSHARLDVVSNSDGIITTMYSHTGQGIGRIGTYSNHPLGLMAQGSNIGGYVYNGSIRAPIFYDSDDTGYYTNLAGATNVKYLQVKGAWGGSPFGSSHAQLNIEGDAYPSITHRNMSTGGYWLVHHAADDTMNWYGGTGGYNGTAWNRNMYLDMAGNLTARGSITAYSDRNLKTNIVTIDNALNKVMSLRGVYFDWIESGEHSIGMIAQEVEEILPELIITNDEREVGTEITKNIIKSLDYSKIVSVLVEAIKEQQKQIEELKAEMQVMKNNSIT